jgi:hypothetical protein
MHQATILSMLSLGIQEVTNTKIWSSMQHNKICDQVAMERFTNKWSWNLKIFKCYPTILPWEAFMNQETPPLHMLPSQPIGLPHILLFQVGRFALERLKGKISSYYCIKPLKVPYLCWWQIMLLTFQVCHCIVCFS